MSACTYRNKEGVNVFKDPFEGGSNPQHESDDWTEERIKKFNDSLIMSKKNFKVVSSSTGKSKVDCMQYYYARFKAKPEYAKFKADLQEHLKKNSNSDINIDYCFECKGMGRLLCCETCEKSFHLQCLKPPLTEVPEGDWHCRECISKGIGIPLKNKEDDIETEKIEKIQPLSSTDNDHSRLKDTKQPDNSMEDDTSTFGISVTI